ncbi:MAG: hypothetical protein IJV34_05290 [Prevotella sp.]|nr:hypothetical protein [Prevotella sp.]
MKKYIKPNTNILLVEVQSLMQSNSVTDVTGVDGLGKGNGDFVGGGVDSRGGFWDDED